MPRIVMVFCLVFTFASFAVNLGLYLIVGGRLAIIHLIVAMLNALVCVLLCGELGRRS